MPGGPWWRAYAARPDDDDDGFWWFSSSMGGRFDLPEPDGTCYLANDPEVSAREYLGAFCLDNRVTFEAVKGRKVAMVKFGEVPRLAHLCSPAAISVAGMTREIHTTPDYEKTQAWALYFKTKGFEGVHYLPRHTMDNDHRSYALFGRKSDPHPMPEGERMLIDVVREAGIEVTTPPPSDSLEYV